MIDHTRCLAPRNKTSHEQCLHRRRFGDFCGIHRTSTRRVLDSPDYPPDQGPPNQAPPPDQAPPNQAPPNILNISLRTQQIDPQVPSHIPCHLPNHIPLNTPYISNLYIRLKNRLVDFNELSGDPFKVPLTRLLETIEYYHLSSHGCPEELRNRLLKFYRTVERAKSNLDLIKHIQQTFRRKHIRRLCGATYYTSQCHNPTELGTLDDLKTVRRAYLYTFRETNGHVYGFDIRSLREIIQTSSDRFVESKNPYTGNLLSRETLNGIRLKLAWLTAIGLSTTIEKPILAPMKERELNILTIFQRIDQFGYPVKHEWFWSLEFRDLQNYYFGLEDIWRYRLNLLATQKQRIVKNPQTLLTQKSYVKNLPATIDNYYKLVDLLIIDLTKLVTEGITRDDRANGVIYVLLGLVEVCPPAANALPQLTYAVGLSTD